jgi:hypothetical protein
MKGCDQCHSSAVGTSEEHFLSRIILDRGLGGPQNNTGSFEEERKALPLPGIESLVLGHPVGVLVTITIMMWQLNEERGAEEKRVCIKELRELRELIGSTECVRLTGFILSFNEYFRTIITQQSVYCEHKGNLQEFKLLCALHSG